MLRRLRICAPVGLSLLLLPAMAYALDGKIDGKPVPEWQVAVDTVWTIVAGILVFLMQAGFAMVEGGFTRAKNVANIMMKNIGDFSMASLGFWILGFGIMFGNSNSFLGTTGFFVAAGTGDLYSSLSWTSVPTLTAWFFQLVFCATAATIVSGAMAERTRFSAYLIFSFIISLIFYPMVGTGSGAVDGWRSWACWISPARRWSIPPVRGSLSPASSCSGPDSADTARPEGPWPFRVTT